MPETSFQKSSHIPTSYILLLMMSIGIILSVIYFYPPAIIFSLDMLVIIGVMLVPVLIGKIWRHEIDRVGRIMRDIEHHMEAFRTLNQRDQEEYEQYHILKSTEQSIETLKQSAEKLSKEQKQQLHYLQKQNAINKMQLFKRALLWALNGLLPHKLVQNIRTVFTDKKFSALRSFIFLWIIATLIIGYMAWMK